MEDTVRQLLVDYQHERQTARAMLREVRESAPCDADPPASEEELDLFRSRYADALTEDLRTRERKTPLGYLKNALEYNSAIKELITATEELVLYQKGLEEQLLARTKICEERIAVVEAALGQSETDTDCTKVVVTQKEVAAAKAKFDVIKADLHKSIRSHYPDSTNDLMTFLQMLIQEKLQNNNYTAITSENFHIIRILKELNMLSSSPYDEMQIRIGF